MAAYNIHLLRFTELLTLNKNPNLIGKSERSVSRQIGTGS